MTLGDKKRCDNSSVNNSNDIYSSDELQKKQTNDEVVNEVYTSYFNIISKEKRKYNLSAKAKLYIKQLLKEYTKDQLISAVR